MLTSRNHWIFNCNSDSSTLESDSNSTAVCSNSILLVRFGISNTPVMVTCNLKLIGACRNLLIYLSIYAVSIGHIVSCVRRIPLLTKMSTCTCYGEYGLISTSCADVIIVLVMSEYYRLTTTITYLCGSTCFRIILEAFVGTLRNFNLNSNSSALKGNRNCASGCLNGINIISAGISGTPVVVTCNLKLVGACCNVLIYLSIYAVFISHIVSCVAGIILCTKMLTRTCYCEGSLSVTSCAKVVIVVAMAESGNDRILTIETDLRLCTCCSSTEICMLASRTKCTPISAALIPCTFLNGVMVSTAGRNGEICCLVPFVVPVVI